MIEPCHSPRLGLGRVFAVAARAEAVLAWFDATEPRSAMAAGELKRERGYFSSNAPRMQYPSFRQRQLPIGSGAVESLGQTPGPAAHEARWLALERPRRARHSRPALSSAQRTLTQLCCLTSYKPRSGPRVCCAAVGLGVWNLSCGWWHAVALGCGAVSEDIGSAAETLLYGRT